MGERLRRLGVTEADLDESFVRSSGPGGQNVNKVSTCVVLIHRPTGLTVKCQRGRSQAQNRVAARELLADRLEARARELERRRAAERARIARSKRGRPRHVKARVVADKRHQGRKKALRGSIREEP